jgi:hypothetical protein
MREAVVTAADPRTLVATVRMALVEIGACF